jgi:hypothetical protein
MDRLFLVGFFSFVRVNLEVLEREGGLVSSDNTEPVSDLVLLQELLGKVLDVSLGELKRVVGDGDGNLVSGASQGDIARQVSSAARDLDTVRKVLFLMKING